MSEDLDKLILDVRERVRYLRDLGVESLNVQLSETAAKIETKPSPSAAMPALPPADSCIEVPKSSPSAEPPRQGSRLASLPSLSSRKTIPFFDKYNPAEKETPEPLQSEDLVEVKPAIAAEIVPPAPLIAEAAETVEQIQTEVGRFCTRCKLSELGRTQVVHSIGNVRADLMFVGEAPGADEDIQGEPFVGRAGQLLTDIIEKGLQIPRKDVFIGNINRCRPPKNRAPEPDEASICRQFLIREITVVRPKVIVVLGATAAHNLLDTKIPISKLRGEFRDHLGTKVMPTFHPSYLLRDPHKKREVWEDMKKVRDYLIANT